MKREWHCCILLGMVSSGDQVLLHLECLDAEHYEKKKNMVSSSE